MRRHPSRTLVRFVSVATAAASTLLAVPAAVTLSSSTAAPAAAVAAADPLPQRVITAPLAAHLDAVSPDQLVRVMVQSQSDLAAAKSAVAAAGLAPGLRLDRIGILTATGVASQIRALGLDSRVRRLDWADEKATYYGTTSHQATRAEAVHDGAVDTDADGALDGFTGAGFSVAIVDSGTDGTHPMFQTEDGSRVRKNIKMGCHDLTGILAGYETADACAIDATLVNDTDSPSGGGHGTHVSGIAAGGIVTDSTGRHLRGAAPDADLVSISTGTGLSIMSGTLALYWVLEHHADPCGDGSCAPIVAVNNSWGPLGGGDFDASAPNTLVQRALVEEGVTVVWAAGNDGGDGSENVTNPPSTDPTPGVLSVANYDDAGTGSRDNALDASSSRGKDGVVATYPDLSAPGANITSACRVYLPVCSTGLDTADPDYNTISGTSMAAPHVAGYVAVLQQVAVEATGALLTPAEVERLLVDTTHQFGSRTYETDTRNPASTTGTSFDAGHGLVDVTAAVESLTGLDAAPVAEAVCPPDAEFTDPAGDATGVLGTGTPLPNAPGLDIIESWLTSDPLSDDVTFHIAVDDLADAPGGLEGTGEYFDYNFSFGGGGYYLGAGRTADEGESFVLGTFGGATGGRVTLASDLVGSFDAETDTISVTLPAATWESLDLPGELTAGQEVAGLDIVARRSLVLVVPDADAASGGCSYTIGAEHEPATPEPSPTPEPEPTPTPIPTPEPTPTPQAGENRAPTIKRVGISSAGGGTYRVGKAVTLRAFARDLDGDRLRYLWRFGDGTTGRGRVARHRFTEPGVYVLRVAVSDGQDVATTAVRIRVKAAL